jgi:hypothetical protein
MPNTTGQGALTTPETSRARSEIKHITGMTIGKHSGTFAALCSFPPEACHTHTGDGALLATHVRHLVFHHQALEMQISFLIRQDGHFFVNNRLTSADIRLRRRPTMTRNIFEVTVEIVMSDCQRSSCSAPRVHRGVAGTGTAVDRFNNRCPLFCRTKG